MPWIELDAQSVIDEAAIWRPRAADNVRPLVCEDCKNVLAERAERLRTVAAAANLPASARGYAVAIYQCHRCNRTIPIYFWKGMFDYEAPPEPVPPSVRPRESMTAGRRYLANTCPYCRALIGQHYAMEHLLETLTVTRPPCDPALERFYQTCQEAGSPA